ncbi:response regulator [Azospirillum sp.]|uniref:response regulator n=1 Tax=Azospirillum sp. TaxID=34012 RepID=UPI003D74DC4E
MGVSGVSDVHVLVVDDEPLAVAALRDMLEWRGLRVTTAENGEAALRAFAESPADLLLTDLKMPRMDGATLIRRLRETHPCLPVIVMTGQPPAGGAATLDGTAHGATLLLLKPISPQALLKDIEAMTEARGCPGAPDRPALAPGQPGRI